MCTICDGKTWDEARRDFARTVETYGWAIQGVEGGPSNPPWAYTVGLVERFAHPELIVAGISLEDSAVLLNRLAEGVQAGRRLAPGTNTDLGGVPLELVPVHPAQFEDGVFAVWFDHYRALDPESLQLTALQVILPDWFFCSQHGGRGPRLDQPEPVLQRLQARRAERRARQRRARDRRRHRRPPKGGRRGRRSHGRR